MRSKLGSSVAVATFLAVTTVAAEPADQELQLAVFVNGRSLSLVSAFTLRPDGKLTSSLIELDEIGILIPNKVARRDVEVGIDELPGVKYRYDEATQEIHFTLEPRAQRPTRIGQLPPRPDPTRPPLGLVTSYTLFGTSANITGVRSETLTGTADTRAFGAFGRIENGLVGQFGERRDVVRLDTTYSYESPARLETAVIGDFISSGFSWTRPIRMIGFQYRRDFGLRPDLVTQPLLQLSGTAAAPSTFDLYMNSVKTLSTTIPQGPFEVEHPPILDGGGTARIVLHDVLGRAIISTTPFYATPQLLARGLTDFSAEIGFARLSYATVSNDYDDRPLVSASYRRGMTSIITVQAHVEGGIGLASGGAGMTLTVGSLGVVSVGGAASYTPTRTGGLAHAAIERRTAHYSLTMRTQRTTTDYDDLASWTAFDPANTGGLVFAQPREVDQISFALPLWRGSAFGVSLLEVLEATGTRSEIGNVFVTQDLGVVVLFANAVNDFATPGTKAFFVGLSLPLGRNVSVSTAATSHNGIYAGSAEVTKQSSHTPGAYGWTVRATNDGQDDAQALVNYTTSLAGFELGGEYDAGMYTLTGQMEGAIAVIDGGVYATRRLDGAFALVDVGVPGVTILRENRRIGVTNGSGKLLVPDLAPFVSNRIALDPAGLPVDAKVTETHAAAIPFDRVAALVDFRVITDTRSALVQLVDSDKRPLELGSTLQIEGKIQGFVVGYDGETFIDDLGASNTLLVTTPDGGTCRAHFHYRSVRGQQVRIHALVCTPLSL